MNQEVTNYIDEALESHQEILRALRKLILSVAPQSKEQFKWSRPVYSMNKDFCYLKTTKKYVTLGFFEFTKIKTNQNLIEGTGKSMRHIRLHSIKEIEGFGVKSMLEEVLK